MDCSTSAVVCSIGYPLAPEFPYPTPINDSLYGSLGVLDSKVSVSDRLNVGIDMSRVATCGTSAGGCMAAQMARRMTHEEQNLSYQMALIPMAKPHGGTRSAMKYWHHSSWTRPQNVFAWSSFLPDDDGTLAANWKVSLLVDPPKETLDQLPPALREEGEMYAHRLAHQGKLIEPKDYDTSHIGGLPGLWTGGAAEGSHVYAHNILQNSLFAT